MAGEIDPKKQLQVLVDTGVFIFDHGSLTKAGEELVTRHCTRRDALGIPEIDRVMKLDIEGQLSRIAAGREDLSKGETRLHPALATLVPRLFQVEAELRYRMLREGAVCDDVARAEPTLYMLCKAPDRVRSEQIFLNSDLRTLFRARLAERPDLGNLPPEAPSAGPPVKPMSDKNQRVFEVNGAAFRFVFVPGGKATIGKPRSEIRSMVVPGVVSALFDSYPPWEIRIGGFWILDQEVSERQWSAVMGTTGTTPATERPKTEITWDEASQFAAKLAKKIDGFRCVTLPIEAEFEWAAQSFNAAADRFADAQGSPIRCEDRPLTETRNVRDLLGGVWELTRTAWGPYPGNDLTEERPGEIVVRGGCTMCEPDSCTSMARWSQPKAERRANFGFRVVAYEK